MPSRPRAALRARSDRRSRRLPREARTPTAGQATSQSGAPAAARMVPTSTTHDNGATTTHATATAPPAPPRATTSAPAATAARAEQTPAGRGQRSAPRLVETTIVPCRRDASTALTSRLVLGIGNLRRASWGGALAPGCSFRGGMRCGCAPAFPATVARMATKNGPFRKEWPRKMAQFAKNGREKWPNSQRMAMKNGLLHDVKRWPRGLDPESN